MDEDRKTPKTKLDAARGGGGRNRKTAIGLGDGSGGGSGPPPAGSSPSNMRRKPSWTRPRTIICERDETIRKGLALMLTSVANVMGDTDDGLVACQLIRQWRPQLVLLDMDLHNLNGLEVLLKVQPKKFAFKALVSTDTYYATKYFHRLRRAGAHGFYRKSSGKIALQMALEGLLNGDEWIDDSVKTLIDPQPQWVDFHNLTKLERDILTRLEFTDEELAVELGITDASITELVSAILSKLKLSTRELAKEKAKELGYVLLPKQPTFDPQTGISHEYFLSKEHATREISKNSRKNDA